MISALVIAALVVSAGANLVLTAIAVGAVQRAHAQARALCVALAAALRRATEAEAGEALLRTLLDDEHARRAADFREFRGQLTELRAGYERVLHRVQRAHAIEGPLVSRRIQ